MLWIPEERVYVRMEDVVVVTADGVENFTADLPVRPDDIEAVIRERGVIEPTQLRHYRAALSSFGLVDMSPCWTPTGLLIEQDLYHDSFWERRKA